MSSQEHQILHTAFELFNSYGIKSVTMDDICKQLGISKKTIYKFVDNKNELVHKIMQSKLEYSENECSCFQNEAKDPIHEIIMIMDMIRSMFNNTNSSLLYDLQKYHHETWALLEKHKNEFIHSMMVDNLKRGIKMGLYHKNIKVDILAIMRVEVMKISFLPSFNPENKYTLEEIQFELLNHFLMGITTIEGHELAENYKKNLLKK